MTMQRSEATATAPAATDRTAVRRGNLGVVLRLLRDHGPRSQARIAQETGLSKATVSTLMADLTARRLVRDSHIERGRAVGRPGQAVELDGRAVCAMGVEVKPGHIGVMAEDLQGKVLYQRRVVLDVPALSASATLDQVIRLLRSATAAMRKDGVQVVGACIAVPGIVDTDAGRSVFAPGIGWSEVDVVGRLRAGLDADLPDLHVENNMRMAAVAEFSQLAGQGVRDMLYVTGDTGFGAAIIANGQLVSGQAGRSGEIGHMLRDASDRSCRCGRVGCWELSVGLHGFLELVAEPDDTVRDTGRDIEDRLRDIRRRAQAGDERTLATLSGIADSLADGIAMLADILDPGRIVLGGYFTYFTEHFVEPVQRRLDDRAMVPTLPRIRVATSTLGFESTLRGAAAHALEAVYQDPTIAPLSGPA